MIFKILDFGVVQMWALGIRYLLYEILKRMWITSGANIQLGLRTDLPCSSGWFWMILLVLNDYEGLCWRYLMVSTHEMSGLLCAILIPGSDSQFLVETSIVRCGVKDCNCHSKGLVPQCSDSPSSSPRPAPFYTALQVCVPHQNLTSSFLISIGKMVSYT